MDNFLNQIVCLNHANYLLHMICNIIAGNTRGGSSLSFPSCTFDSVLASDLVETAQTAVVNDCILIHFSGIPLQT